MKAANANKGKKTHWLRTTLIVLIVCGLVGCGAAYVVFKNNAEPVRATARIELNFQGANEGKGINGNPFDLSVLTSDEVLAAAIAESGLDLTVDQVRENLTCAAVYPENVVADATTYDSVLNFGSNREYTSGNLHSTLYSVRLTDDFGLSKDQLTGLLDHILSGFRGALVKELGYGFSAELVSGDRYDYVDQISMVEGQNERLAVYAEEIYEAWPLFRKDGMSFNDIALKFRAVNEDDLPRLNAYLTVYALSRDQEGLAARYQFLIRENNMKLAGKQKELGRLDELVQNYDKNEIIYLSYSDKVEKLIDSTTDTYDQLAKSRQELSDEITDLTAEIEREQRLLLDLTGEDVTAETEAGETVPETAEPASETEPAAEDEAGEETEAGIDESLVADATERQKQSWQAALESRMFTMEQKETGLLETFTGMVEALNANYLSENLIQISGLKYDKPSLFSMNFLKQAVKYAGALCAVGLIVCLAGIFISRRKEAKRG